MTLRYTLLALVIGSFAACTSPEQNGPSPAANETLIKQYYRHFNGHQWTAMAAMYADSAQFKDPSLGPGVVTQTRKQVAAKYAELANTFPDVHDEVIQLYPSGSKHVIVELVSTGTAPDSSKFELPICTVFTIENGKITNDFTYYDNFEDPKAP
jgi:steroid delta-isomerase-like uncharacterized protein